MKPGTCPECRRLTMDQPTRYPRGKVRPCTTCGVERATPAERAAYDLRHPQPETKP